MPKRLRKDENMRLRRKMIDYVAKTISTSLIEKDLVTVDGSAETLMAEIRRLVTEDLLVEDRLNEEVKEILRAHTNAIDRDNIDYSRMFAMIKRQLVKERGLIL
jgi:hypothetical protein